MTIITLLLTLVLFGFLLWLALTYIPMPDPVRKAVIAIAVILLIIWLLQVFGLAGALSRPIRPI